MNFKEAFWLSGGANSFLATLRRKLINYGLTFTNRITENFDVALLNALTDGLNINQVKRIHDRGIPIIHRKVGYRVSGTDLMRSQVNGVIYGDKLQIDFSPYVQHTIFQSNYSRDAFFSQGFSGNCSVIRNGVDTDTFNRQKTSLPFGIGSNKSCQTWDGISKFRFAIVTWSKDANKGFADYRQFDLALDNLKNVEIWFVGRVPDDLKFRNIRTFSPRGHKRLAALLKQCHGFIQMAKFETCSNALIEAMSCGLPVIYKNSGSAVELAASCGVEYRDNPIEAIQVLMNNYYNLVPFACREELSIDYVANAYLNIINMVSAEY